MTWHAPVTAENPLTRMVEIQAFRSRSDGAFELVSSLDSNGGSTTLVTEAEGLKPPDDACLRIPEDIARALLDGLSRHFGATSDSRTLRSDYVAERGRVDRLIGALIGKVA